MMRKLRIFVLGLPQTPDTAFHSAQNGFSCKIRNLCSMLHSEGHHVTYLGVEGAEVEASEIVSVMPREKWAPLYEKMIEANPADMQAIRIDGPYEGYIREWVKRTKIAIIERSTYTRESIVCLSGAGPHEWATEGTNQITVECGIGYPKAFHPQYRIYESYAWLHTHLGAEGHTLVPKWYWAVIPCATDEKLYRFNPKRGKQFLFFGRMTERKGIQIAIDITRALGERLTMCGNGDPSRWLTPENSHVDYVKPIMGDEQRRELFAECKALICPTTYVEPFGRVVTEAGLSGAPCIATDYGGFTETIIHGVTGYRCRTMDQFVFAAKHIDRIKPKACREWAENFTLKSLAPAYTEVFNSIMFGQKKETGWDTHNPERANIDWLNRNYLATEIARRG